MWSSWPCVITNPLTLSLFSSKNVISGITQSIPNISSSGNDKPQSTTIIPSLYSNAVMFIPICSSPPNGITFILELSLIFFIFPPKSLFTFFFSYTHNTLLTIKSSQFSKHIVIPIFTNYHIFYDWNDFT